MTDGPLEFPGDGPRAVPDDSPTVIRVTDASKRFVIRKEKSIKERLVNVARSRRHKDDFWALRDVSVDIKAGSTVGLIGPNGSGKSTLLKLIGGILQPTSGTVEHRGRLAALLELGAGFHPDLTGRENVYLNASILGLTRKQTDEFFDAIVTFSGIEPFIDTQVKFYSSGMYVRLAFAVAVHVDPDVLLVDEVLAVGDEPFQRKCMDRIRDFQREGRTIVLVTHSLDVVAELCDRAIVLENGRVQVDGKPKDALRHLRADFEEIRQEELAREREQSTEPIPEVRIEAVQLLGPDGEPVGTVATGSSLEIRVDVQVDGAPIEDAVVGFVIDTALGQTVFGTNTKHLKYSIGTLTDRHSFTFRLEQVPFIEGTYGVNAAIASLTSGELHRVDHAASLVVLGRGQSTGMVDLVAEVAENSTVDAAPTSAG